MHIHDLTLLMSHDIHNDITNMNTIREHIITQGLTRINEMRIRGVQPPKTKKKPQQRPRNVEFQYESEGIHLFMIILILFGYYFESI